jgi:hypothetical protein
VRRLKAKPEAKNTRNTKKCVIFQISDRRELRNGSYKAGYSGLGATYLAITASARALVGKAFVVRIPLSYHPTHQPLIPFLL